MPATTSSLADAVLEVPIKYPGRGRSALGLGREICRAVLCRCWDGKVHIKSDLRPRRPVRAHQVAHQLGDRGKDRRHYGCVNDRFGHAGGAELGLKAWLANQRC